MKLPTHATRTPALAAPLAVTLAGMVTLAAMAALPGGAVAQAPAGEPAAAETAAPASAPSNAERILNDRYTRSHDYDLVHQRIEVRDFDWDSTSFEGRVSTTLVSLRPRLDSLILDAGSLLGIRSVTGDAGYGATGRAAPGGGAGARASDARPPAFAFDHRGDTLVIRLPGPVGFGDTIRFAIDYDGKVENGRGLTFIESEGRPHRPRQIWSQGEDDNNHDWFPTYDFPNDKMSWELAATVPAEYTAVSNGRLVADTKNADGTRTMTWRQEKPSATYLVSLIVAPLARVHDEWQGKPVDYYVYREDEPLARRLFGVTPDMIQLYSDYTGIPYPWAKYAQTTVADFFGGMENVSATTLVDWLPDARAYADRPWYQWILIPHELAHQWFGDYVTTENWANMWLNEGFAEFLPGQYWRARQGEHAGEDYYLDEWRQFMAIEGRRSMPLASLGSNNIYPKGALVIEMLRKYLGDAPFQAGIHRFLVDHAYDNATTDDLRQAFLEATGENLDWFFDEWVYSAGYPAFTVTSSWDPATRRVTVVATQTQTDSLTADSTGLRYRTPEVFRMPVTVRVGTADGGDVVARSRIDQRVDTLTVDGVASEPAMVVFDDGNRILKTLEFEQPTARLAAQLRRDPDLWDRSWVIDQLSGRTDDVAAAAALADAARSADYFLTRAEAAEALGAFPADRALPALEAAATDTSAQVRAAAVSAVGHIGMTEAASAGSAASLAGEVLQRDSSYAVRAAAVVAVARIERSGARDVIRAALAEASYQAVVRQAALQAVAGLNDTTFIADLSQLLGEDRNVAITLGALAAQGSQRAADALVDALNDERPFVRRWALTALANRLEPGAAVARLKAAAEGLRFEDTKEAVKRAIERLEERTARRPGG